MSDDKFMRDIIMSMSDEELKTYCEALMVECELDLSQYTNESERKN